VNGEYIDRKVAKRSLISVTMIHQERCHRTTHIVFRATRRA